MFCDVSFDFQDGIKLELTPFRYVWKKVTIRDKDLKLYSTKYLKMLKHVDLKLDFSSQSIPDCLNQVETLHCSSHRFKYLPDLPKIKYLLCEYNLIEEMGEMPRLEVLNCSLNKLKRIRNYPNLRELECSGNFSLEKMEGDFPLLKFFCAITCPFKSLPLIPNVVVLHLQSTDIKEIPTLEHLKYLNLSNMYTFHVKEQPNLECLIVNENDGQVEHTPKLRYYYKDICGEMYETVVKLFYLYYKPRFEELNKDFFNYY